MSQAMSCSNIAWKVGPFIDGELPPSEREEVALHLTTCTECVAMVAEFRRLDALAAGAGTVPSVSGDEWARLWEKVQAGAGSADAGRVVSFPASRGWLVPCLAAAAALLVGVFLGRSLWDPRPDSGAGQVSPPQVSQQNPPENDDADGVAHVQSGPQPRITVDEDVIFFEYKNF
jgi:anti-sigma factor RsiW